MTVSTYRPTDRSAEQFGSSIAFRSFHRVSHALPAVCRNFLVVPQTTVSSALNISRDTLGVIATYIYYAM